MVYWSRYWQQSQLGSAQDQKSLQLSLTQVRLPSHSSSESQSPPPSLQGDHRVQQSAWLCWWAWQRFSSSLAQQLVMEEVPGAAWGQLWEPQTRRPAQSESVWQVPSPSSQGELAEQRGSCWYLAVKSLYKGQLLVGHILASKTSSTCIINNIYQHTMIRRIKPLLKERHSYRRCFVRGHSTDRSTPDSNWESTGIK